MVGSSQINFFSNVNTNGVLAPVGDSGSDDTPLSKDDYDSLLVNSKRITVHLPVVVSGFSIFYSVHIFPKGEEGINLTRLLMADIIMGRLLLWMMVKFEQRIRILWLCCRGGNSRFEWFIV